MWPLPILFVGILLGSAICSLTEAALLSLPVLRARMLVEERRRGAKTLLYIKENIHITIASIVFVNNAVNIIGSIFIGRLVAEKYGDQWLGAASAVMTLAIIIGGEIFPKAVGERYKIHVSLLMAKPTLVLVWVLKPIVLSILKIGGFFSKPYISPKVTEEEIKMMLKMGRDVGTVEMDEEVLCNRIFRLNDLKASQMMRPFEKIFALCGNKTLGELRQEIIDSRFSRIAVYDKDPSDIFGVVEHRLLLRHVASGHNEIYVKELTTPAIFVDHAIKADALLQKFQAYNQHLFIVKDDRGKNIGLITMEDVLEEIFGEIYDEKDARAKAGKRS